MFAGSPGNRGRRQAARRAPLHFLEGERDWHKHKGLKARGGNCHAYGQLFPRISRTLSSSARCAMFKKAVMSMSALPYPTRTASPTHFTDGDGVGSALNRKPMAMDGTGCVQRTRSSTPQWAKSRVAQSFMSMTKSGKFRLPRRNPSRTGGNLGSKRTAQYLFRSYL